MNDIRCPHCKKSFKADEVFSHHLDEERKKVEDEKIKLREDAQKWREAKEKEFAEEAVKLKKRQEEELRKKLEEELSVKLKDSKNETEELALKNKRQQDELLEMNKAIRLMKTRQEELELENQKKLAAAEDAIKAAAQKKAEEQAHFKILELEKKLNDVQKVKEDLQRKVEQGSQQMQGEVLELELEKMLVAEFPFDEVKPVPKGIRGADILQIVRNNSGLPCGVILWELKRTKAWSNDWVQKLKEDQRTVHADCAILISQVIPDSFTWLGEIQGVVVAEYKAIKGVARLVRTKLIEVALYKNASQNSDDKKDVLYNYVTSKEFRHRMDALAESFTFQQEALESEKRWFAKKWANQEKALRKMIDNTFGLRGELEVIMGRELESSEAVDLLPGEVEVEVTVEEQLF
jgi:hypothetical protein